MSGAPPGLVPLALVSRGSIVESIHFGVVVVVDARGRLVASAGDPERVVTTRSCIKTLQAIPLLETFGAGVFDDDPRALALMCASHHGEPMHAQMSAWMLSKLGLGEADLRCGVHPLTSPAGLAGLAGAAPTQLHNNCSGKHSGMLALASHLGASFDDYTEPHHPVQQAMWRALAEMTGLVPHAIARARDGCSAVTYGVPMSALALAAARLADPHHGELPERRAQACRSILAAVRAAPEYAGGTRHIDTALMRAAAGRIYSKVGAEALHLVAVPADASPTGIGLGVLVKLADGLAERARAPVVSDVLGELEILTTAEREALLEAGIDDRVVRNHRDLEVGSIKTLVDLERG